MNPRAGLGILNTSREHRIHSLLLMTLSINIKLVTELFIRLNDPALTIREHGPIDRASEINNTESMRVLHFGYGNDAMKKEAKTEMQ